VKRLPVKLGVAAAASAALLALSTAPAIASSSASGIYKNCTAFHTKYKHGVGRKTAHDHTSGKPVTDFLHSTTIYNRAMSHNRDLDRDKDGIACEKA
jgi:hypothetical protein